MAAAVITPEERLARSAKAGKLADAVMPFVATLGPLSGPQAAEVVRKVGEDGRAAVAALAGTRMPSPHTWNIVAALVRTRVENGR